MGARRISIGALGLSLVAIGGGCRVGAFDELSSGGGARDAATEAGEEPDAGELDADETEPLQDASTDATGGEDGDGSAPLDASGPDVDGAVDSGVPSDAGASPDAVASNDAGSDAAAPDAGPITRVFEIQKDEDDALWRVHSGDLEELLHFDPDTQGSADFTIEVGTDSEECRAGLRFSLPLARGSKVVSARLTLTRVGGAGNVSATRTMRVSVFDADNVPMFVGGHAHATPALHVTGGLWSTSVAGFVVGPTNAASTSQDLSVLVQHVVDRAGWIPGAYVGFVISPDTFAAGEYMQIADFEAPGAAAPQLSLSYFPP